MRQEDIDQPWSAVQTETRDVYVCCFQQPYPYYVAEIMLTPKNGINYPPDCPEKVVNESQQQLNDLMKRILSGANQIDIINQETFKRNSSEHKDY